ncbi:hypothetical protein I3842_01G072400 [Carya illinoinensis]|uniref:Cyclic nucleotide-binding domain-containing protein n=1 Tax=Carya illinoinensis TaxID=32201 RepID=A0A922G2M7_CARIL|nr:hypothetical protein I3842_01G072400 [Carya illinoinensis]
MDSRRNNFVRNSSRPTFGRVFERFRRGFETIRSLKSSPISIPSVDGQPRKDHSGPKKTKIFDPQDQLVQTWNKIFVLSCVVSVALDPLFFYTPVLKVYKEEQCLSFESDKTLEIIASVLRSVTDAFYAIHIYFQFRTGIIPPSSRHHVFGWGELIVDPKAIAKRYLSTYFIIDILGILPCPQAVVLLASKKETPMVTKELLKLVIFSQYVPRLFRIYPLHVEVVGAFWYLFGIDRQNACWQARCSNRSTGCTYTELYCSVLDFNPSEPGYQYRSDLQSRYFGSFSQECRVVQLDDQKENSANDPFDYGIFTKVLKSEVVAESNIRKKVSYCFWWGLRSLSSFGQNLDTSTYFWEIVFAVSIAIAGLVLFSLLTGNMQKYLQSTTVRVEEMRVRKTDAEQWMSQRMLPENLRERVRRYEQYKWLETRGVDEENLFRNLPKDLRRDIKRYLCLDLLKKVPMFAKMDQHLWDPLVDRLKPVLYTQFSYIVREGDPVDEMLFIMQGKLATFTTNGGIAGFFNIVDLKAGDFCGEELLTWALYDQSSTTFPHSTRTVEAKTEVQAFALMAEVLKTVASQFRKLHTKEWQHTFKFYSQQWRTWAACFIQSAWRRYSKKKHERALRDAENRLQFSLANEAGTSASLGATIYALWFAAHLLRALRRPKGGRTSTKAPQRVLQLMPPKPVEPDFSANQRQ